MSKLREQLIKIQRQNYRKNVKLIRKSLAHNASLDIYEKEFFRELKNYQEISNKTDLIKKVLSADIVFHGDYHTLKQSQQSILRILRDILGKREIILCLEMFHGTDQKLIDSFMAGNISEESFLNKIHYIKKWPFGWNNWKPVIAFCIENQIPVLGINSQMGNGPKSLRDRDKYSSRIIVKSLIRNPGKLIYVVDGDFHISPNHLPMHVGNLLELLDIYAKRLFIYQNVENLYWKLCQQGKEESDVLKISENRYCVMNTLPANKVQSYLNWLEFSEDAYYPVHQNWEDDGFEGQGLTVQKMVATIVSILKLELPPEALNGLSIYYSSNLDFMDFISRIPELKCRLRLIKEKIKREEGFLLEYESAGADTYLIYLPNSNINQAAEEASHLVNAVLRGRLKFHLNPFDRFYRNVIIECLGFFGSKFINEKRKSQSEYSLRKFLGQIKQGEFPDMDPKIPQVARCILQHFYLQRKTSDPLEFIKKFHTQYKNRSSLPRIFSTQLGYMLGNKLFYAVKKGKFPLGKIQGYYKDPLDKPNRAFECYLEISNRVKKMKPVSQY